MNTESGGYRPKEIIGDKEKQQPKREPTKIKRWHRVTAGALTTAALLGGGFLGLRALAGGENTEVRPQTSSVSQSLEPTTSSETEQTPTLENLIGETQTDLANKSIDLLNSHPEDAEKTAKGFTMKIISGASDTGEKTNYSLEVEGVEKNGSYDQSDISSVHFTIINTQKNAPESERLLYDVVSDTPTGEINIAYSDFKKLPFDKKMDDTFNGRNAVEKMQEQIGTLFTAASEKKEVSLVERPY